VGNHLRQGGGDVQRQNLDYRSDGVKNDKNAISSLYAWQELAVVQKGSLGISGMRGAQQSEV
jgi:hypothetical protein